MRYTVTCAPGVDDELADIWLRASDPQAVTDAANEVDRILRVSPLDVGIESGQGRVFVVLPLAVVYTVSPDDCLVTIWGYSYLG